jgi:hypothetical protein
LALARSDRLLVRPKLAFSELRTALEERPAFRADLLTATWPERTLDAVRSPAATLVGDKANCSA